MWLLSGAGFDGLQPQDLDCRLARWMKECAEEVKWNKKRRKQGGERREKKGKYRTEVTESATVKKQTADGIQFVSSRRWVLCGVPLAIAVGNSCQFVDFI